MNKDAWYQYFTECEAVTDRNAELVEEKFKECEAYTEQVLKKTYLYGASDDTEVLVLNEDAPIKGAVPIENVLSLKGDKSTKLVLMYQSKNRKEGTK